MNSVNANQLSDEFETALSEVLPNLYQLLQNYQVTGIFNLFLLDQDRSLTTAGVGIKCCSYWDSICNCYKCKKCRVRDQDLGVDGSGEINSETLEHLCTEIESTLSASKLLEQLGKQRASQPDESFEVHLLIDLAIANPNLQVACQWVKDVLQCSIP